MCVLHTWVLVALIVVVNLLYCPSNGWKHCKKADETGEEYMKRNLTSAEAHDCQSKIGLQLLRITVLCEVKFCIYEQGVHFCWLR